MENTGKKKEACTVLSELWALRYFERRAADIEGYTQETMKRDVSNPERCDHVVDEEASWRRFQECVPKARIVTDASIENLRRDGMVKHDYELNAIKCSKGEHERVKFSETMTFINATDGLKFM